MVVGGGGLAEGARVWGWAGSVFVCEINVSLCLSCVFYAVEVNCVIVFFVRK